MQIDLKSITPEAAAALGIVIVPPKRRGNLKAAKPRKPLAAADRIKVPRTRREPRPPCPFLGSATGRQHKVGCVATYLDEHFCHHPLREVVTIHSRRGTQSRVLTPKAIPRGRCRDLDVYRGAVVACVDCPLYRAGLLTGPATG